MIPMPGKIIVKQDGAAEKRGGILVSQRFAEKDRPMTGRVMAVGPGKPCEIDDNEIERYAVEAGIGAGYAWYKVVAQMKLLLQADRRNRPVSVKAGDHVVFKVFAGDGIEWTDGSMCRCLTEDDLLAVILE